MQSVGAALGDGVDDGSPGAAEFGIVVRGLGGDFLDGVGILELEGLAGDGDVVVLGAIDQEIVRAAAGAVDGERADTVAVADWSKRREA